MSEIFVDTIKNKAGSTSLDSDKLPDMYSGSAKAWFNLNYSTSAVTDSLNIASLTDNGTGDHDLNFTNNMGNTTYALSTCGTSQYNFIVSTVDENSLLTTDVRVQARTGSQSLTDSVIVLGSIHGDLA